MLHPDRNSETVVEVVQVHFGHIQRLVGRLELSEEVWSGQINVRRLNEGGICRPCVNNKPKRVLVLGDAKQSVDYFSVRREHDHTQIQEPGDERNVICR